MEVQNALQVYDSLSSFNPNQEKHLLKAHKLLMQHSPVFEYISTETLIHEKQMQYYSVLEKSDKAGDSTAFLEFSLEIILIALKHFKSAQRPQKANSTDRIHFALEHFRENSFSRKKYLELFPEISTATASRDLALAVKENKVTITGEKAQATYKATTPRLK